MQKIILLICGLLSITAVYADNNVCVIQGGGTFDTIVAEFARATSAWQVYINPMAKNIFYLLFATEFMWQFTVRKVFAGDTEKLWVFFFSRMMLGYFFSTYLVDVVFYQELIDYVAGLAGKMSGFVLNPNPGAETFATLSPSEIMAYFGCVADMTHQITDVTGSMDYITFKIVLSIAQVVLFVLLAIIAYALMKVLIQTYFMLYAGFFLTGFAGSSWTFNFWHKYLRAMVGLMIKFFMVCLVMGVLQVQINSWLQMIADSQGNISLMTSAILNIMGGAVVIAFIAYQLPEWAAASLSGEIMFHFDDKIEFAAGSMAGTGSTIMSEVMRTQNATSVLGGYTDSLINPLEMGSNANAGMGSLGKSMKGDGDSTTSTIGDGQNDGANSSSHVRPSLFSGRAESSAVKPQNTGNTQSNNSHDG